MDMNRRSPWSSAFIAFLSGAALALTVAACGGPDDDAGQEPRTSGAAGGGGKEDGSTLQNVCDAIAKARCEGIQPCCDARDLEFNRQQCESRIRNECYDLRDAVHRGSADFDPSQIDACLDASKAAFEQCAYDSLTEMARESAKVDESCLLVFPGKVELGEACEQATDCKLLSNGSLPVCNHDNRCEALPEPLKEGEPCVDLDVFSYCEFSLYCDSDTGKCEKRKEAGEVCDVEYLECAPGLGCDEASETCTPLELKELGESCSVGGECASQACDDGECVRPSVAHEEVCGSGL